MGAPCAQPSQAPVVLGNRIAAPMQARRRQGGPPASPHGARWTAPCRRQGMRVRRAAPAAPPGAAHAASGHAGTGPAACRRQPRAGGLPKYTQGAFARRGPAVGDKRDKVLVTGRIHGFALDDLRKKYDVDMYDGAPPMPRADLLGRAAAADAIVCFPYDRIDAELIAAAPRLRAIATFSVGYDHVDVEAARRRGIAVGYTPDVLTEATADLAMALILDAARRVSEGDRIIRSGGWKHIYRADEYVGFDLHGATLGVVGLGRIGAQVAKRAEAFGMRIVYCNSSSNSNNSGGGGARTSPRAGAGWEAAGLDDLLSRSDVVTIHAPLNAGTDGMIDLARLRRMKATAILVNTARGRIVKEGDLARALGDGIIAGAALDVFESEPLSASSPLAAMPNVVLAPHIGSSTDSTRAEMARLTVRNVDAALGGGSPVCPVPIP